MKFPILLIFVLLLIVPDIVSAGWWDSDWNNGYNITISTALIGNDTIAYEQFPLFNNSFALNITRLTDYRPAEVRIVNASCNTTKVPYEVNFTQVSNTSSSVEVVFHYDKKAGVDAEYCVYWNNTAATYPNYEGIVDSNDATQTSIIRAKRNMTAGALRIHDSVIVGGKQMAMQYNALKYPFFQAWNDPSAIYYNGPYGDVPTLLEQSVIYNNSQIFKAEWNATYAAGSLNLTYTLWDQFPCILYEWEVNFNTTIYGHIQGFNTQIADPTREDTAVAQAWVEYNSPKWVADYVGADTSSPMQITIYNQSETGQRYGNQKRYRRGDGSRSYNYISFPLAGLRKERNEIFMCFEYSNGADQSTPSRELASSLYSKQGKPGISVSAEKEWKGGARGPAVDTTPPVCVLDSVSIPDIEANSTGTFEMIVNCSDASGINTTTYGNSFRSFFTMTVDDDNSTPNRWQIYYPDNDLAVTDGFSQQVLRATGRNESYWYETLGHIELDNNIFDYAVYDGRYGHFSISDTAATWTTFNISGPAQHLVFKQSFPLNLGKMQKEEKLEYEVYKDNSLMVMFYDLENMESSLNYSLTAWGNFNYTMSPVNKDMLIYYCNQSYLDVTCGGNFTTGCISKPQDTMSYCVYLNSIPEAALNTRDFTNKNSSYVGDPYGIINQTIAGIHATNISYITYRSRVTANRFTIRYATGSSGTNVRFNESNIAFSTTDDGLTYTQFEGTPDIFLNEVKPGDQFQLGGCTWDLANNSYCNYSFYTDDIGAVNFPISSPNIQKYLYGNCTINNQGLCSGIDEDKNGTHSRFMTIHVNIAIDPDKEGNVTHNLTLRNTDGTLNYTINTSFISSDDSDMYIIFNTSEVSPGSYKMNITATAGDDPTDIQSHLTEDSFIIETYVPPVPLTFSPLYILPNYDDLVVYLQLGRYLKFIN